jgi:hypothetical protein
MNKRGTWCVLSFLILLALIITNASLLGDEDTGARALSIVVEQIRPPEGQGFSVELSVNKGCGASYSLGETVTLSVRSAQAGYLTIYDFSPDGRVTLIFPNYYQPNNKIEADTIYIIPDSQAIYKFVVGPPQGMDILKAIVTTTPGVAPAGKADADNPYPNMSQDQREFARNLNVVVAPQSNWGAATCVYYIGPTLGSVAVNSIPQGVEVYWDGAYYWQTPVTIYGQTAGPHNLVLKKDGYQDWSQHINVVGGKITPIMVTLQPIGMGWQARPKAPAIAGDVTELWANAFNSNGSSFINGWYWLTDPAFQAFFGWRFPIESRLLASTEAWLNLAPLVTNTSNGGPGFETIVQISIVIRDAYGTVLSQTIRQIRLTNPFHPKSPINSNGVGYGTYGLLPLEVPLAALPLGGMIEVVASRLATSYDGIYQPHVAFNPEALVLRYR